MTLRLKLLVLVAGVTLFAATGVTTVALWRGLLQAQQQLSCEGASMASSIALGAQKWVGPNGPEEGAREALLPLLQRALETAPLVRAWIVDRQGVVAACADLSGRGCRGGMPGSFRATEMPMDSLRRLVGREPLEASAPIVGLNGSLAGAVRISYRSDGVLAEARRLATGAAVIALAWIVLGLSFGNLLLRRITRPLTEVVRATEKLSEGERIEVKVAADPELSELVGAFNRMSARLRESREQMEHLIATLNERVARATEEGLRAERLVTLGGIAAGFAHEMGNSLHVISGFAAIAARELPPDHPNRADMDAVRREAVRASAMLERFLFFARARSARRASQSVEPVLREAVEVIEPAAVEARVTTELRVCAALPDVNVDAELLRQAFVNLCVNAIQAMKGGGKLSVRALQQEGEVVVEFEDTGPGVPLPVREHIFEPFFTTKEKGTGLGLAIVRQAAEAHGGKAEVEDTGHGALFRIRIPWRAAA
ncbi:MAG: sensor histidine kinase [Deltaproteobacteria bacterium]